MNKGKVDLYDLNLEEMKGLVNSIGEPAFRAKQLVHWMYEGVKDFSQMKNLPKSLIIKLEEIAALYPLKIINKQVSKIDGTTKYLFELFDGNAIESVFMRYKHGNSICISSQVGCRMGCKFCASTLLGLERNLSAGEFIKQILAVKTDTQESISNIVVMGTGEPFDNYESLSKFLMLANSEYGLNIGMRRITVSSCGIVPEILNFAKDFPQVNLAISLHATENEKRSGIMPINKLYDIQAVLNACKEYYTMTKRRVSFEYALIHGVNDRKEDLDKIAELLQGFPCHLNLIALNEVEETGMKSGGEKAALRSLEYLKSIGVNATLRRKLGEDIDGACGQLRIKRKNSTKNS